jgi:hypothetical protein
MLGIWRYFWDEGDWGGVPVEPGPENFNPDDGINSIGSEGISKHHTPAEAIGHGTVVSIILMCCTSLLL